MKTLIWQRLYSPAIVLPMLALTGLMVALDFNLVQVVVVACIKTVQHVIEQVARRR